MVVLFLVFKGILKAFSVVALPIHIPTSSAEVFPSLHTFSSVIVCGFFDDGHSDWSQVLVPSIQRNMFTMIQQGLPKHVYPMGRAVIWVPAPRNTSPGGDINQRSNHSQQRIAVQLPDKTRDIGPASFPSPTA